jgi:3-phosphoshikimate 1-carboxyvinyltransferase
MTLRVLEQFGVRIEVHYNDDGEDEAYSAFRIKGRQIYISPGSITVEGDWSNAAFWLGAGAVSPFPDTAVTCRGLNIFSSQGDRKIVSIIKAFGGNISKSNTDVTSSPGDLSGIEIDAMNIPDLIPVIAVIASVSSGTSRIFNAERLRIKESDRLHALYKCLAELGADIEELSDSLIIRGKKKLEGGTVSSCGDHRIVMAMAIAALCCKTPVIIKDAEAVNKSYPRFFDDFRKLGGDAVVI